MHSQRLEWASSRNSTVFLPGHLHFEVVIIPTVHGTDPHLQLPPSPFLPYHLSSHTPFLPLLCRPSEMTAMVTQNIDQQKKKVCSEYMCKVNLTKLMPLSYKTASHEHSEFITNWKCYSLPTSAFDWQTSWFITVNIVCVTDFMVHHCKYSSSHWLYG